MTNTLLRLSLVLSNNCQLLVSQSAEYSRTRPDPAHARPFLPARMHHVLWVYEMLLLKFEASICIENH